MTERPILFNGDMVRAILEDRKTQTRRMLKGIPCIVNGEVGNVCPLGQVGDRLWVRETFVQGWTDENGDGEPDQYDEDGNENPMKTFYRADGHIYWEVDGEWCNTPWKPSIHMPRWASRITLEITNVRVELLQDISTSDCIAEGIKYSPDVNPSQEFQELWDSIYKNWDLNPWVWVIEFKRIV